MEGHRAAPATKRADCVPWVALSFLAVIQCMWLRNEGAIRIRCKCGHAPEQDGQSNSSKQSSDLRNVVNRGVDGILQLVFEYGAEFREGFVIGAWISFSTGVRVVTRATIL